MALQNPNNLYSEGNVSLDSSPYMRIVLQQRQRKEANDYALDKYYGNLPNTVNEKNVRDQEIPVIHQIKDDLQGYWMQNRDAIRKGNTPEAYNYGKMIRDANAGVNLSKNRTDTSLKIAKLRGNPKYDYIFKDKDLIEKIRRHDLPITDPDSEAIDFNQLTLPPPPHDQKKYLSLFKDIKSDYKTETKPNPNDKFTLIEVQTPSLSEDSKQAIYQRAAENLIDNPSFEATIKKAIDTDPNLIGRLRKTFQDNYGRDIDPETADHDMAAAYTLLGMGNEGSKERVIPNTDERNKARNAEWSRRNRVTDAQKNARLDKMMGDPDVEYPLNVLVENYGEGHEIKSAEGFDYGTIRRVKESDIPVGQMDLFNKKDRYGNRQVEAIIDPTTNERVFNAVQNADGNWELVGKGGKKLGADDTREKKINVTVPANKEKRKMFFNKGKSTTDGSKPMTLAEKMKAAKKQK